MTADDLRGDRVTFRAQVAETVEGQFLEGELARPIVSPHR